MGSGVVFFAMAAALAIMISIYKVANYGKPSLPRSELPVTPMTFWRTVLAVIVGMAVYSAVAWLLYLITH
jgi:hypothetical protein